MTGNPNNGNIGPSEENFLPVVYCSNCGAQIEIGAKFCEKCGMKNGLINGGENQDEIQNQAIIMDNAFETDYLWDDQAINVFDHVPAKTGSPSKVIAVVCVAAILIASVVAGIFLAPMFIGTTKNHASNGDEEGTVRDQLSEEPAPIYGSTVTVEQVLDGSGYQYAVFTGISSQGETVWTYQTEKYPVAQLDTINEIGAYNGNYYLVENGSIRVLNIADGSTLWINDDFGGSASCSVFDDSGTLYLCGYYGPDLFIVDVNGNTLQKIDSFDNEYHWPHQITYHGSQVAITFEGTASATDEVVYVDLNDYSTSIARESPVSQDPITAEVESEIPQIHMAAISSVTASSYLTEPQLGFIHAPSNVTDGSLYNAWVENASGQGEGESITLQFDGTYKLSGFTINAGYQKSSTTYENNSRPADLKITFSDGNSVAVSLKDINRQQEITFSSAVETSSVTFTIVSVYPGSRYQDTAISEISLF